MKKSLNCWRKYWDATSSYDSFDIQAGKTLDLLSHYAHFFQFPVAWGGKIGRFFTGHWNTHHGDQIQRAIENFYHYAGEAKYDDKFHDVEYILACVKQEIGNNPINPDGDLARILQVIKEKTKVDYFNLNSEAIIQSHYSSKK